MKGENIVTSMIKIAFGSVPKDGGTFTFYRNQRPALLQRGFDLRCVTVGSREVALTEQDYVDDGCVFLAEKEVYHKKQAQAFVEWCEVEDVQIVIAVNSEGVLSALPHLPERIRVISRCANAFDEGYRYGTICQERYAAMVALTPRLQKDLVADYGANPELFRLIPNGIDPKRFELAAAVERGEQKILQLGFLGRLEHKQKGVLYLPEVVNYLREQQVDFKLRIAGKGIHREELEGKMAAAIKDGQVEFVGQLTPDEIPEFLGSIDLYLFTSHFEGCPNALLEAMMAGCVPVSWIIDGITDFLLDDNKTGALVAMGDCQAFALRIIHLGKERDLVSSLSKNAALNAKEKLSTKRAANAYAEMFHDVMNAPAPAWTPRPWSEFQVDPIFAKNWKSWIPESFKNQVKHIIRVCGLRR
ncbi:glycosyltransferase family 4 protein [Akkermansiaceae bacterium]|nr:glycosyltransferase family 4 protein [Akkermansiaceae bacterium]